MGRSTRFPTWKRRADTERVRESARIPARGSQRNWIRCVKRGAIRAADPR